MAAVGYDPHYWAGVVNQCEAFAGTARGLPQNQAVCAVIDSQPPARRVYIRCAASNYYYCGDYFRDRYQDGFLHGLLSSWGRRETVVIHQAPPAERRPKTEEEKREASSSMAIAVGTVALLVAACLVGIFHGQYDVESKALKLVGEQKQEALQSRVPHEVVQLLDARAEIHERKYENSRNRLFSAVTALVGGVGLLAGGAAVAPMLITAGYAALLAGTAFGLYNACYHWGDEAINQALCAKLQLTALAAKKAIATDYSRYVPVPLYPDFPPPPYHAPSAPPAYT